MGNVYEKGKGNEGFRVGAPVVGEKGMPPQEEQKDPKARRRGTYARFEMPARSTSCNIRMYEMRWGCKGLCVCDEQRGKGVVDENALSKRGGE